MSIVRIGFVLALVGCSSSSSTRPDAQRLEDAPVDLWVDYADAAPVTCAAESSLPLVAREAYDVASNGTTLYLSVRTPSDSFELQSMSISGGTPTTLVTSISPFQVTALGNAVFYARQSSATNYEIHQIIGTEDTKLADITSSVAVSIGASDSDVYVAAHANNSSTLWRVPRAGGSAVDADTVTSSATACSLVSIGVSVVLWSCDGTRRVASLQQATTARTISSLPFVGDEGFVDYCKPATSHTLECGIRRVYPDNTVIFWRFFHDTYGVSASLTNLVTDGSRLYLTYHEHDTTTSSKSWSLWSFATNGTQVGSSCLTKPLASNGQQDATNFYGLVTNGTDSWRIEIYTKP